MKKIFLLLSFFAIFHSHAQKVYTFADCLQKAMAENPLLKSAEISERIALTEHRASYGQFLPVVFAEAENRNAWGKEIDPDTNIFENQDLKNTEGTLNANFNLFKGLAVHHSIKAARQEKEISRANLSRLTNEVSIDLAQRFISILYLQEIIAANQEQIKSSEKQLEIAQLKFNSGVISESELFKIKSQKASEELNYLNNQNRLNDNMISLKQIMNLPLEEDIALIEPELKLDQHLVEQEDQYEFASKAVPLHPSYQMMLLEQQKMRTELALARAARYPTLGVRFLYRSNVTHTIEDVSFDDQLDENTSKGFRFYLTIPIFNQFATASSVRTRKMLYKQAQISTKIEENRLSKEVLMAINNAKTALKKNEASGIAYEFSQKSYDADALKFEVGKININELNTSKIIFNNTQAELIQAKYELLFNNALIRFYKGEPFTL